MIRSMTGYGRGESKAEYFWVVELKSVNHRFLDIYVRLPRPWLQLEEKIKNFIKEKISRGRVDVFVSLKSDNIPSEIKIDKNIVENYYKKLVEIKQDIGFEGPISLSLLSMMPEIFSLEELEPSEQDMWDSLEPALNEAVSNLIVMRQKEGHNLWQDILMRLQIIEDKTEQIYARSDVVVEEYRQRLVQNIQKLAQDITLDPERLEAEVVLFAERSNITEEVIRLRSHIEQLRGMENSDGSVGKKMEFIIQEMYRETNTIGSKSSDNDIIKEVIEIKSELEKIRNKSKILNKEFGGNIVEIKLINIGFGNIVSANRIIAIVSPESAPIKRIIQEARDRGMLIDATYGRRTRAVIITDSDHVILSAVQPETVAHRLGETNKEDTEKIIEATE